MCLVFLLILLTLCTGPSIRAFEAMYEAFEQLNGTDFVDYQLRVTKFNRTTPVLNGTMIIKVPFARDTKVHVTAFHSSKGNQQFTHYPIKIPTTDFCTFTSTFWPDYIEYYQPYMENIFRVGECPVEPREIRVNKHVLEGKMFPSFMAPGLWKVYTTMQHGDNGGHTIAFTFRLFNNGFFG